MADRFVNHYQRLGLTISASASEIREAFQRRVRKLEANDMAGQGTRCGGDVDRVESVAASPPAPQAALQALPSQSTTIQRDNVIVVARSTAPDLLISDDPIWHSPSSVAIVEHNTLDDAYTTLSHPATKEAYDMRHEKEFCTHENARVAESIITSVPVKKKAAVEQARRWWRASLKRGHDEQEARDGRVAMVLERRARADSQLVASSRMAGPVVTGFIETMEL